MSGSKGVNGFEAESYDAENRLLAELTGFGRLRCSKTLNDWQPPQGHPKEFQLFYMVRGHVRWRLDENEVDFDSRQWLVIPPGEVRCCDAHALQSCEYYWMRLKFSADTPLPGMTLSQTDQIHKALARIQGPSFAASPVSIRYLKNLREAHQAPVADHASLMAQALLHALLVILVRDYAACESTSLTDPVLSKEVQTLVTWLESQVNESVDKDESASGDFIRLAKRFRLSPAVLQARFNQETGYSMHKFLLHQRLKAARSLLTTTSDSITSIALDLGFSSSQYFATVFKRHRGISPRAYRRLNTKAVGLKV